MGKFLLFVAALWLAWWYFRRGKAGSTDQAPTPRAPERMVVCAQCGVHLPESDSLAEGALHYCSPEHQQQGPRP